MTPGPVVWVSEEGRGSLGPRIDPGPGLSILDRRGLFPQRPWADVIADAADEAHRIGPGLIVIDTFSRWAGLGPEAEKDAGAIEAAIAPLLALAAAGFAVLVVHHDRKGGGDDGEAARGSGALLGNVDCYVQIPRRPPDEDPSPRRTILAISRWDDATPEALVYERQGDGELVALAEGARCDVAREGLAGRVFDATPADGSPVDAKTIGAALGISDQRAREGLAALARDDRLEKLPRDRQNEPQLYRRPVETPPSKPPFRRTHVDPLVGRASSSSVPEGDDDAATTAHGAATPSLQPPFDDPEDWRELVRAEDLIEEDR